MNRPDVPTDPLLGALLGGSYRIDAQLGAGGMGAVYRATQVRLGKSVAVKTLHAAFADDEEAYHRFRREALIASDLGHPHIVTVLDFDRTPAGLAFMVMELLDGEDLGALLAREGRLSAERFAAYLREICSGLSAAHEKGVVHRDLKPQNIFLTRFGERPDFIKVLDFGISKIRGSTSIKTATTTYLGTPQYMAPEQAEGRAADADQRSDVYALGAVAYRALAGRDAFSASSIPALLYRIVHQAPTPLVAARPELPAPLCAVVERALAKRPDDRFEDAAGFAKAFAEAAGGAQAVGSETTSTPALGPLVGPRVGPRTIDQRAEQRAFDEAIAPTLPPPGVDDGDPARTGDEENKYHWLDLARSGSNKEVARQLSEGGLPSDGGGEALQMAAAWVRRDIVDMLLGAGVDVDSLDEERSTALHVVVGASSGRSKQGVATLELLLDRGADVDHQNARGSTALAWAAWNGNDLCVPVLLHHGASTDYVDEELKTPLIHASEQRIRGLCHLVTLASIAENLATFFGAVT